MLMGKFAKLVGSKLGGFLGGQGAHHLLGAQHGGCGRQIGEAAGSALGSLVPFKNGGRVKKTGALYAHKGNF